MDRIQRESGFQKALASESHRVDKWARTAAPIEEAVDLSVSRFELADDFLPDLEAAGSDRGSEPGERDGRIERGLSFELVKSLRDDPGGGPSPARMNVHDHAMGGIDGCDRKTVGDFDPERDAAGVSKEGVAVAAFFPASPFARSSDDPRSMDLMTAREPLPHAEPLSHRGNHLPGRLRA